MDRSLHSRFDHQPRKAPSMLVLHSSSSTPEFAAAAIQMAPSQPYPDTYAVSMPCYAPCYDTLATSVLAMDIVYAGQPVRPVTPPVFDEQSQLMYLEPLHVDLAMTRSMVPGMRRRQRRQIVPPEVLASRRAHRRMLQKGYERDYRQRKREHRNYLRDEWLALEAELKRTMIATQNRTKLVNDVKIKADPSSTVTVDAVVDLQAEWKALAAEAITLQCMLTTAHRFVEAEAYFTQPTFRETLNTTAASPSLFQYEFVW